MEKRPENLKAWLQSEDLPLYEKLNRYESQDIYPFHMPGHKRRGIDAALRDLNSERGLPRGEEKPVTESFPAGKPVKTDSRSPERIDITEITGFDNLHHAEGILKKEQEHLARVFGADQSFYLVNGSTAGLLAAISAAVPRGGTILIARNCHRAVYHAILLRQLKAVYLCPQETAYGIQGSIAPADVEAALAAHPQTAAILITSPTYDGVVSDIAGIRRIAHARGLPLIVDEAHGAHFGFAEGFPEKALTCGADAVIESLHKTLPAYTQSAALHLKGGRISPERVQKFLSIYQSSSPSYILMSGLSRCTAFMEQEGPLLLKRHALRLRRFYAHMEELTCLEVPMLCPDRKAHAAAVSCAPDSSAQKENPAGIRDRDISKILIFCEKAKISGQALSERLLYEYRLEMEMVSGNYVTALTGLMDTDEGIARLEQALFEIDRSLAKGTGADMAAGALEGLTAGGSTGPSSSKTRTDLQTALTQLFSPQKKQMELFEADEAVPLSVPLLEAEGKISGEFVFLYPPGIPFLVPGEIIPAGFAENIRLLLEEGYAVQGPSDPTSKTIQVIKE